MAGKGVVQRTVPLALTLTAAAFFGGVFGAHDVEGACRLCPWSGDVADVGPGAKTTLTTTAPSVRMPRATTEPIAMTLPLGRMGSPRLAAIDTLGVGGEELVTCFAIESGCHLAEGRVELVEGPVHGVDREVAGEEAAVDTEGPDGVLEPRPEGVHAHGLKRHGQARELAHDV